MKPRYKIQLLRPHRLNGFLHQAGRILDVREGTAKFLITTRRGKAVDPVPGLAPSAPARRRRRAVTPFPAPPTTPNE